MYKDSLANKIQKYTSEYYPLHMPGHKGGRLTFLQDIYLVDVTETSFTDDLYDAKTILKDSLYRLKSFYKTKATYFLTGGSTVGVISALGIHSAGDEIVTFRGCHKSVYNGVSIFNLKQHFIDEIKDDNDISIGVDLTHLENILKVNDIKSVIITSPTYEGVIYDIKKIKSLCVKYGANLIVDEAHGAHINFFDSELSATCCADIVVQSMHKTLPTITGCGLIHINNEHLVDSVFESLKRFQTSSPSYVMMCEMDEVVCNLKDGSHYLDDFKHNMDKLISSLSNLKKIHLLCDKDLADNAIAVDISKVTLVSYGNGYDIERFLLGEKFVVEMATKNYVVCIFTIADSATIFGTFAKKVKRIDGLIDLTSVEKINRQCNVRSKTHSDLLEVVPLEECIGRVCARKIIPYPPGVPIIIADEIFNEYVVDKIKDSLYGNKSVYGLLDNGFVEVYK